MLEILLLVGLSKGVGAIVQKKGRKPLGYKLMLVAFWIMGEIGGFVVAGFVAAAQGKQELDLTAYVFALVGAACGAALAFAIAAIVPDISSTMPPPLPQSPFNFPPPQR